MALPDFRRLLEPLPETRSALDQACQKSLEECALADELARGFSAAGQYLVRAREALKSLNATYKKLQAIYVTRQPDAAGASQSNHDPRESFEQTKRITFSVNVHILPAPGRALQYVDTATFGLDVVEVKTVHRAGYLGLPCHTATLSRDKQTADAVQACIDVLEQTQRHISDLADTAQSACVPPVAAGASQLRTRNEHASLAVDDAEQAVCAAISKYGAVSASAADEQLEFEARVDTYNHMKTWHTTLLQKWLAAAEGRGICESLMIPALVAFARTAGKAHMTNSKNIDGIGLEAHLAALDDSASTYTASRENHHKELRKQVNEYKETLDAEFYIDPDPQDPFVDVKLEPVDTKATSMSDFVMFREQNAKGAARRPKRRERRSAHAAGLKASAVLWHVAYMSLADDHICLVDARDGRELMRHGLRRTVATFEDTDDRRFVFHIKFDDGRRLVLQGRNQRQQSQWVTAINNAASLAARSTAPQLSSSYTSIYYRRMTGVPDGSNVLVSDEELDEDDKGTAAATWQTSAEGRVQLFITPRLVSPETSRKALRDKHIESDDQQQQSAVSDPKSQTSHDSNNGSAPKRESVPPTRPPPPSSASARLNPFRGKGRNRTDTSRALWQKSMISEDSVKTESDSSECCDDDVVI